MDSDELCENQGVLTPKFSKSSHKKVICVLVVVGRVLVAPASACARTGWQARAQARPLEYGNDQAHEIAA
jgi:hypothetical protein